MARGKKKETGLTPEGKLAQALVPDWEKPYHVPKNWIWSYIRSGYEVTSSKRVHKDDWLSEGVPFYRTRELVKLSEHGYVDNELFISEEQYEEYKTAYGVPQIGDLLISGVGTIGVPYIVDSEEKFYFKDGNIIWFKNKGFFLPKYIYYLYKSLFMDNQIHEMSSGTTVDTYTIINANNTMVPIPPLSEQQRIIDRIEYLFAKLDEAKEKAQSVLDSFETRKAAILHKAFTGELTAKWRAEHGDQIGDIDVTPLDKSYDDYDVPHDLPSSWRWVRFNDCCTFVGSGVTPKGGKEVYQTTGVPFIRSQNVLKGILDLSDVAYIPFETDAMMKRTRIRGGETLFNITGASIGRACFVPYCQTSGNVNQHVCILRYKKYVIPELPQFWLNSPAIQDFVVDNQIGQTRQALNFKQIRGMYYPLAPIEEQNEIVRILDSLFAKEQQAKEAAEAVQEKVDLLKKSILARAFRGELGTNDPSEESAVELLKSILELPDKPKTPVKRTFIPKDLDDRMKTDLERKIIKLYIQQDVVSMSIDRLMPVSSKKFDVMEALRNLQQRGILVKENDMYKLLR